MYITNTFLEQGEMYFTNTFMEQGDMYISQVNSWNNGSMYNVYTFPGVGGMKAYNYWLCFNA